MKIKSLIILFVIIFFASYASVFADQKDVLKAMEKLKSSVEVGIAYNEYCQLLVDAKTEINIFKRSGKENKCFIEAIEKSYQLYDLAKDYWKLMMDAESFGNKFSRDGRKRSSSTEETKLSFEISESLHKASKGDEETRNKFWHRAGIQLDKAYNCLK